jgi:hypothetical protein
VSYARNCPGLASDLGRSADTCADHCMAARTEGSQKPTGFQRNSVLRTTRARLRGHTCGRGGVYMTATLCPCGAPCPSSKTRPHRYCSTRCRNRAKRARHKRLRPAERLTAQSRHVWVYRVCLRLQERGDHQEDLADVCGVSKQRVSQMVARGWSAWETVAWMADLTDPQSGARGSS